MKVSIQCHTQAASSPGKIFQYPPDSRLGEEKNYSCRKYKSESLVTILIELPQMLKNVVMDENIFGCIQ
jgi:hypothetical protein